MINANSWIRNFSNPFLITFFILSDLSIILIFPYINLLIPEVFFDKAFHVKLSSFHNSKLYLALGDNYLTLSASMLLKN